MPEEVEAQLQAGLYVLSNLAALEAQTPISVVFDNKAAAQLAASAAKAKRHLQLDAATATVWQIASARTSVQWAHAQSHMGEAMNELADSCVEFFTWRSDMRTTCPSPCCHWAKRYSVAQTKLMYLLHLPAGAQHAYPSVN